MPKATYDFKEMNCIGWKPIKLSIEDAETTKRQVENHNDFYFAQCQKNNRR